MNNPWYDELKMADKKIFADKSEQPIFVVRKGERAAGKVHAFALELNRIANDRRAQFIYDLTEEIKSAMYQNEDVRSVRVVKVRLNGGNEYEDPYCELIRGKNEALRGILEFIAEQQKHFIYSENDSQYTESEDKE